MNAKLIELKNKKTECFRQIYQLTLKQKECLALEDIEELQHLIDEKQLYMDKVDRLDRELEQLEGMFLVEVDENCKNIIASTVQVDKLNRQIADGIFQAIKEKLGQVRQGKKLHNAYNPTLSNSAFLNKAR